MSVFGKMAELIQKFLELSFKYIDKKTLKNKSYYIIAYFSQTVNFYIDCVKIMHKLSYFISYQTFSHFIIYCSKKFYLAFFY